MCWFDLLIHTCALGLLFSVALHRHVTPDMVNYFVFLCSEKVDGGIKNLFPICCYSIIRLEF